jgi:hypothetical protein
MRLEVTVHRSVGDRHGGGSYRAYGRAGVPAGHVSDRVTLFPGKQLLLNASQEPMSLDLKNILATRSPASFNRVATAFESFFSLSRSSSAGI